MRYFTVIIFAAACVCCSPRGQKQREVHFVMPEVPAVYSGAEARAAYLAGHYWDSVDFADSLWLQSTDKIEKALPDYLVILRVLDRSASRASTDRLLERAAASRPMFDSVTTMLEKYLDDPNSPMRDEATFINVLEGLIASPALDSLEKLRPAFQLEKAQKNRPGMVAADFTYETVGGRQKLSALRSPLTLLLLYNPGCHGCTEVRTQLEQSPPINAALADGKLKLLAVLVDGERQVWLDYSPQIPARWINAYDFSRMIDSEQLYDLRALPTIYLLDGDKRVILKDVDAGQVEQWLINRQG